MIKKIRCNTQKQCIRKKYIQTPKEEFLILDHMQDTQKYQIITEIMFKGDFGIYPQQTINWIKQDIKWLKNIKNHMSYKPTEWFCEQASANTPSNQIARWCIFIRVRNIPDPTLLFILYLGNTPGCSGVHGMFQNTKICLKHSRECLWLHLYLFHNIWGERSRLIISRNLCGGLRTLIPQL